MNKDHVEIWNSCLSVIKDNVTEQGYKTWFEPIVPLSLTDNVLTLQVPTQFFYRPAQDSHQAFCRRKRKAGVQDSGG